MEALLLRSAYPSNVAYYSAISRLRGKGLIAHRSKGGRDPVLSLTPQAEAGRPDALRPERFWNQSWNRIWYIIAYDVPESNRIYRNALRGFLRRMRMGRCSSWLEQN